MRSAPAQHHSGGCGAAARQRMRGASRVQQARLRLDLAWHAAQNGLLRPFPMNFLCRGTTDFASCDRLLSLGEETGPKRRNGNEPILSTKFVSRSTSWQIRARSQSWKIRTYENCEGFSGQARTRDAACESGWSLMRAHALSVPTIVFLCRAQWIPRNNFNRLNRWSLDSWRAPFSKSTTCSR